MEGIIEHKDCPYCAEKIAKMAKKCKHCGEIIDAQMRDIEALKRNQNVIVNNNNNNNNNNNGVLILRRFPHLFHFILSLITGGLWICIWIIHYLCRDRRYYV